MKAMNVVRLSFTGLICAGLLTACYDPNGLKAKRSYPKSEWDKYLAEKAKAKGNQNQNQKQTEMQPDADDLAKMKQAQDGNGDQQDGAQSKTTTEADASANAWVKETEGLLQSKLADADKVVAGVTITFDAKSGSLGLDALVAIDEKTTLMVNGASAAPLKFESNPDKLVQTIPVQVLDVDGNPVADEMAKNVSVKAACIAQGCDQVLVRMRVNGATGLMDTVYLITANKQNIYQIAESNVATLKDFETAQNELGQVSKTKTDVQKPGSLKVVDGDKADSDKADVDADDQNVDAPKTTSTHSAPYVSKAKIEAAKAAAASSETSVDKSADGKVVSTPHGDKAQVPGESAKAKAASAPADLKAQIAKTPMTEVKAVAPKELKTNKADAKTVKDIAPVDYQDSKPLQPLKLLDLKQGNGSTAAAAQKSAGNSYQDSKPLEPLKLLDLGREKAQPTVAASASAGNGYQDSKPLQPLKLLDLGQKAPAAAPAQQKQAVDQKGLQDAQKILVENVGTRQIMQKDGSTKLIKPDGTVIIINADGSIRN